MRRSPLLTAAVSLAAALTLTLSCTASASASGVNYVALGDSYSSGVGSTFDYLNTCDQSARAFPYLYDDSVHPSSFSFQACTGATASDIENNQLSALNSGTTLISLTDGGNDIGFSTVMEECVFGDDSQCENAIATAESETRDQLPGTLGTLYTDIRRDAPNAHVVVLGYPEFYDLSHSGYCLGLDSTKRADLNRAADLLDQVIAAQTARFGGFTFEDVRPYFSGHQICDDDPWLLALTLLPMSDSYHPTAAGQSRAYLPAFEAGI